MSAGTFVDPGLFADLGNLDLELRINGSTRQKGNSSDMITSIPALIAYTSRYFTMLPGDVIMTGTPAGVGPLNSGDQLSLLLDNRFEFAAQVA